MDTFGTGTLCADDCLAMAVRQVFGLTPLEIIRTLAHAAHLCRTACYGHFGARSSRGSGEQGAGAAGCGVVDIDCGFVAIIKMNRWWSNAGSIQKICLDAQRKSQWPELNWTRPRD